MMLVKKFDFNIFYLLLFILNFLNEKLNENIVIKKILNLTKSNFNRPFKLMKSFPNTF